MSRSNPTLRNPATRKFEWAGSTGQLSYYDKEKGESVVVKLPFEFMVLDQMSTITGWNQRLKSQIWSNEVRAISKDVLYVSTKGGPLEAALYNQLAATPKHGGKYTKVVYIGFQDAETQTWMIGKIMCVGSSLRSWIDFSGKYVVEEGKTIMSCGDAEDGVSGQFFPPKFAWEPCGKELNSIGIGLDAELQRYLNAYTAIPRDEEGQLVNNDNPDTTVGNSGLWPSESRSQKVEQGVDEPAPGQEDVVITDIGDEPINLDDIPF